MCLAWSVPDRTVSENDFVNSILAAVASVAWAVLKIERKYVLFFSIVLKHVKLYNIFHWQWYSVQYGILHLSPHEML